MASIIPNQVPFNLDLNTNRNVSWQMGDWVYSGVSAAVSQLYTSGTTLQVANNTNFVSVNPAAVVAALAITLPALPVDGDKVDIAFGGTIAAGASVITALTVSAPTGTTIYGATPASPVLGGTVLTYRYASSTKTWTLISTQVG